VVLRRTIPVAVALLLAAGCGGGGGSSSPTADPTTAPSAPTVVTTIEPSALGMRVLRTDGLGPVDFGVAAEEAMVDLTSLLGAPDRVEPIAPLPDGCVEGAGWLDCVRGLRLIESGQLAIWDGHGLEVALVDTRRDVWPHEQAPLQFGDWHATVGTSDTRLVTEEGLSPGMTVGQLRTAVPSVEFTYNEGVLDSYSVTSGANGGYWGRLDWDPTTPDIESFDIATVQTALNKHGADVVVDGQWGPRTRTAWLEFLTENSLEPLTPQLWLTPEVGGALGLPPDEIVVATIEPRPPIVHLESPSSTISLRPDGLGPVDFGTPMDAGLAALVDVLGAPDSDSVSTEPECTRAIEQARTVSWDSAGLHVTFTDWPGRFDAPPAPLHLASWTLWSIRAPAVTLTTADGIGIGSTAGQVRSLPNSSPMIPDVTQWGFQVAEPTGSVSGEIGWSVDLPSYFFDEQFGRELQQALNRQGANLAVDGIVGPRTIQALTDFAEQRGIDGFSVEPVGDSIQLTTAVLEAFWLLELPPDGATVTSMWAGDPSTCD
jgi:peptidoglycan hydrolase-like protein with peptidoglycan-binding domain